MKRIIVLIIAFIILALPDYGICGRYELLKSFPTGIKDHIFDVQKRDLEVCSAYELNLNSFPDLTYPMVCERPINTKIDGFTKSYWIQLNPSNYKDIIKNMDRLYGYYKSHPNEFNEAAWWKNIDNRIAKGWVHLRYTKLDVDPKITYVGGIETSQVHILEYDKNDICDPKDKKSYTNYNGKEYYITNASISEVKDIIGLGRVRGVFVYKGQLYFDAFSMGRNRDRHRQYEIWLYRFYEGYSIVPICRFRFIGNVPEGISEE